VKANSATQTGGEGTTLTPVISVSKFCRDSGISTVTAWRYRKRGWIETVNIAGKQYLTAESLAEFKRRALAGDFAITKPVPVAPNAVKEAACRG